MAVLTFSILVIPVIVWGSDSTSEAWDQNQHHLKVVDAIRDSLDGVDGALPLSALLKDYPSATSPGYHLLMAWIASSGVQEIIVLRLISSLFGLALVLTLWRLLCRYTDGWTALTLSLPLMCSPYFLSGCMWLTTDVAALLFVVLSIGFLLRENLPARAMVWSGVSALLAVFVRQPTVWLVAPITVCSPALPLSRSREASDWVAWMGACALPLIMLGWLVWSWGGLMPPAYRSLHDAGANPATPAVALSLVGCWSFPWVIIRWRALRSHAAPKWLAVAVVIGLACALVPETAFDRHEGRWGGPIWSLVRIAPQFAQRSIVFVVLAPLGALSLLLLFRAALASGARRATAILAVAALAFLAAITVNTQCWERYLDMPILAFLPLLVAVGVRPADALANWEFRLAGIALAVVQLGLSGAGLYMVTFAQGPR